MKTGFIGVGNMGGAILKGYADSPQGQKDQIMIFSPNFFKKRRCFTFSCTCANDVRILTHLL